MTLSPAPPPPPPRRNRPSGPRKQGPRQHLPSVAPSFPRSTLSPAPGRDRLIRSPAPAHKSGQGNRRHCQNPDCQNSDIIEDEAGGGLICQGCGMVVSESNIVAENTWIEGPGGTSGMAGQYVGGNQSAPRTITGMKNMLYGAGREAQDSKIASETRAKQEMATILENIRAPTYFAVQGVQIYKLAVQHGLLHGRTVTLVAAVALYVALRRSPKDNAVMLMDIASATTTNVFVLGSLYTRMVEKLKGIGGIYDRAIEPISPESLLSKFAGELEFGTDRRKITREALTIVGRMKRDWMAEGRRPAGICGAAIVLAARMNNYRRTVREVVLICKVTEITLNKRLDEFKMTDASKWDVQKFREMANAETDGSGNWIGGSAQSLPPSFYAANMEKVKKKRGRPRKVRPGEETAAQIEGNIVNNPVNVDGSEDGPPAKRPRYDKEGFAIPEIPIDPKLRQSQPSSGYQPLPLNITPNTQGANTPEMVPPSNQQAQQNIATQDTTPHNTAEQLGEVTPASSQRDMSVTPSTRGDTPMSESSVVRKKRGRRPGQKNSKPPPPTPSELAVEDELERDIRYGLEEVAGSMEEGSDAQRTAREMTEEANRTAEEIIRRSMTPALESNTPSADPSPNLRDILNPPSDTPTPRQKKVPGISITPFSTVGNTNTISLSPTISATEFDSDPDVSACLLTDLEKEIKERIWVAENADWLRKDHAKKIKRQLDEQRMKELGIDPEAPKKKGKKKVSRETYMADVVRTRRERTGADGEVDWGEEAEQAANAMLTNRAPTTYSRRFNQDIFKGIMNEGASPSSSSRSRSRSHSVASHISIRSAGSGVPETTLLGEKRLPFDEVGPLGPTMARTKHSLAAEKREAAKRAREGPKGTARGKGLTSAQAKKAAIAKNANDSASQSASPFPTAGPSTKTKSKTQTRGQLPTPAATQSQPAQLPVPNPAALTAAPLMSSQTPSRPSSINSNNPDIEMGEVEVIGSINSPLSSSIHSHHSSRRNSPALGVSQEQGFGGVGEDDDDDESDEDEDGEDVEEYYEDDEDVDMEPVDDPEKAFRGEVGDGGYESESD